MVKLQLEEKMISVIVEKGIKALLLCNYKLKGKSLKEKFKNKKIYDIPIIIEASLGCDYYQFKVWKNLRDLKVNNTYKAYYKLIKFVSDDVWDKINKKN